MTRKRRFFIFFSSAAIMSIFIFFSLSVRPDNPLNKWLQWLPGNKVKSMILDRHTADGKVLPRNILYEDSVLKSMETNTVSKLELRHNLREAEVEFSHERTTPRTTPKHYYLLTTINKKEYFLVVQVHSTFSTIIDFGEAPKN